MNDKEYNDIKVGDHYWVHSPYLIKGVVIAKCISIDKEEKGILMETSKNDHLWIPISRIKRYGRLNPEPADEPAEDTKKEEPSAYLKTRVHNAIRYIETLADEWKRAEVTFVVEDDRSNLLFRVNIIDDHE